MLNTNWEIPQFTQKEFRIKRSKYCVCIPVINEGTRIQKQLTSMQSIARDVDIIIADGGSADNSLDESFLKKVGVRTLLIKKDIGKLSAQLRMGFAYALYEGYEGIITIDGNGKDGVGAIYDFIRALDDGYDFVQGSRFVPGGKAVHTPLSRMFAIRYIHAPLIRLISGFHYTDTTNGFRGHSKKYLLHPAVQPFRKIFDTYELLAYLSVKAPQLKLKVKEVPVSRSYPSKGATPTKIGHIRGNYLLLKILLKLVFHAYDPKI